MALLYWAKQDIKGLVKFKKCQHSCVVFQAFSIPTFPFRPPTRFISNCADAIFTCHFLSFKPLQKIATTGCLYKSITFLYMAQYDLFIGDYLASNKE